MKTIYFVRHAKSSWDYQSLSDINRPLNDRGIRDAPFMGKMLHGQGVLPDIVMTSPAVRATTTALMLLGELEFPANKIQIIPEIYSGYLEDVLMLIKELPDDQKSVMLFGHNPTWTSLANYFSEKYIPNAPTCSISVIEAEIDAWKDLNRENGKLTNFYYPKMYFS